MSDHTVLELQAGTAETWRYARRDSAGAVIAVTGSEVCTAAVWAGDATATLFSPTVTPDAATDRLLVEFTAVQTGALTPATTRSS